MRKIISVFLALTMIFSMFAVSASAAANEKDYLPIITIAGSSIKLVDADQKQISTGFDVFTDDDEGDLTTNDIISKVMKVMTPFVLEGLPFDKWDNYGNALYEELAPIFEEGRLDNNGNPNFGTGVSKEELAIWDHIANTMNYGMHNGQFDLYEYRYRYDWRLSPYDVVDGLDAYIDKVLKTTNCKQVCLVSRCLGGNVITAYLDKYGSNKKIAKVVYDEAMSNGSATINDVFSGKIKFSDKHMQSYVLQTEHFAKEDVGFDVSGINSVLLEVIENTLDLATQTGVIDTVFGGVEQLYERLYKALMPSFLLASGIATWPGYWTSVCNADMDKALDLMFGAEGTEKRAEYRGLVDKILYLRERFIIPRERTGEANLYKQFEKNCGVKIAVLAGYGLLQAPVTESYDATGDCTVDLYSASFGATAAGVYSTLSDEYIAERTALGYGDYISADKKVDASTCLFPDTTWIMKNKHHDLGTGWEYIARKFCRYKDVTVTSYPDEMPQFIVVKTSKDLSADGFAKLTEDNASDVPWLDSVEQKPTTESKLTSLMKFLTAFFKFFTELLKGNINFDFFS